MQFLNYFFNYLTVCIMDWMPKFLYWRSNSQTDEIGPLEANESQIKSRGRPLMMGSMESQEK